MKYALIIALLFLLALFVYWRLRPYLRMARNVLGFVRDVRRMNVGHGRDVRPAAEDRRGAGRASAAASSAERLVRCSSCGAWLPASRAITLRRSNEAYCSRDCVERPAAERPSAKTFRR